MASAKQLDVRHADREVFEVWWGGTDLRYACADTLAEAKTLATEFKGHHPNVYIVKITTTHEQITASGRKAAK